MDHAIKVYSNWLGRRSVLGDLTKDRVIDFIAHLLDGSTMSRASIKAI